MKIPGWCFCVFAAASLVLLMTRRDFTRRLEEDADAPLLPDSSASLCGRQAAGTRRDGHRGRVRRQEGRQRPLRSRRLLHSPSHHPQTAVMGKPPPQRVGLHEWTGLPAAPLFVSLTNRRSVYLLLAPVMYVLLQVYLIISLNFDCLCFSFAYVRNRNDLSLYPTGPPLCVAWA